MIDAVLSYHMNPATCGVAKFNHALAKRLGVPARSFMEGSRVPLVSVKFSELLDNLAWHIIGPAPDALYDVFLHDVPLGNAHSTFVFKARRVYAANEVIADSVRAYRPDVITAHCPSTVEGNADRGDYRVLTFGMAHKVEAVLNHFRRLRDDLERDHPGYTLSLSMGLHEGTRMDEAFTTAEAMREIFGERLRVLGFLADDALARELAECDAVAAFFVPALRANNTSAWAALAAGKFLYTNLDAQSPALDPEAYGWDALLKVLA